MRASARILGIVLLFHLFVSAGRSAGQSSQSGAQMALRPQDRACNQLAVGGECFQLDDGKIDVLRVQGNVYMISGAGSNITVQIGDQAVMMVDTGVAEMSDKVISAIHTLTDRPIYIIVSTSMDPDHTGGNGNLSKAGWATPNSDNIPFGHDVSDKLGLRFPAGAAVLAHLNMLNRMSAPTGQKAPVAHELWPTDTYESDDWRMYNSEEVYIYHLPAAHTDGDSIVMFRRSGVVSTGDLFMPLVSYPVIDVDKGGTIDGFIKGLNQIIDLLVPEDAEEGGTYVIPGHGRICDRNDIVNYRDMVTILRGRIAAMVEDGMTLEQVKASKPTADYDVLGHYRGTSDRFVEGVYRDLNSKRNSQQQNKAAGTGGR